MLDWTYVAPIIGIVAIIVCVGYSIAKRRTMTFGIMFACVFVFILELASLPGTVFASYPWVSSTAEWLSFQTSYITEKPMMLYTIFTSMFVHSGIGHLIFNLLSLLMIGTVLEDRIGAYRIGIIYFAAGIFATFFFAIFTPGSTGLLMGASGAFCGLLGAFTRLYPREKISLFMFFIMLPPLPMYLIAILFLGLEMVFAFLGGFNLVGAMTGEGGIVANTAHIGGFIFGLVVAPWIMKLEFHEPGKTVRRVNVDMTALRRLAITEKQKEMIAKIEKEDEPDVKRAWIEKLVEKSRCPDCGRPLLPSDGAVKCRCGYKLKF